MTRKSTTRSLVCALVVLSLCASIGVIVAPETVRHEASEFQAFAPSSSTVLLARTAAGHDHARQRSSAPSLFTLVPFDGSSSDSGYLAGDAECRLPRSIWTAGPWTGRSPPVVIS